MKRKGLITMAVLVINALFIALAIHLISNYSKLSSMQISPEIRLKTDEEYLRILCYQFLPAQIVVASLSTLVFWMRRK